jgi:hypothetical protein
VSRHPYHFHGRVASIGLTLFPVYNRNTNARRNEMFVLKPNEFRVATVVPKNAAGEQVPDARPIVWSASAECVRLTPSADGLSCEIDFVSPGEAVVTATDGVLTTPAIDLSCQADTTVASLDVTVGDETQVAA